MEAKSVRNMYSNIAVTNKHTAKLHHVGFLYILTYDARKLKHKIYLKLLAYIIDKQFYPIISSSFSVRDVILGCLLRNKRI